MPGPRTIIVAACLLAAGTVAPARAELLPPLLEPTPLVLKDGRIAQVAVRIVPFAAGSDQLAPATRIALEQLGAGLATDCFLTAQAIGHAEPAQAASGDPLAAHRLERARAERVQAVLTAKGLPPSAIAAVGDRSFIVREPQVTLWLFMLRPGEGCTGRPTDPNAVAAGSPPDGTPSTEPAAASAAATAPPTTTAAAATQPPAEPAMPAADPPTSDASTEGSLQQPEPPPTRPEGGAAAKPAPATDTPPAPAAGGPAIGEETDHATAAGSGPVGAAPDQGTAERTVEIVFDLNSSYLPDSAATQLNRLLSTLERDHGWRLELTAAVGSVPSAKGSTPARRRYDRWLAERRLNRVEDWLRRNAQIRDLDLTSAYSEGDASRRVIVHAAPR